VGAFSVGETKAGVLGGSTRKGRVNKGQKGQL
jgi:hypothetical protein